MNVHSIARMSGGSAYLWMAARARNALRRVLVFGIVGGVVFIAALIAFVLISTAAFVAASASAPLAPELIRRFGKLLASVLFFLVARALLTGPERLVKITRWLSGEKRGLKLIPGKLLTISRWPVSIFIR